MRTAFLLLAAAASVGLAAQTPATQAEASPNAACRTCIQAHENFFASDALRGRGSGTQEELIAATYIASRLEAYGIEPAAVGGGYIEIAPDPARP
ncbi:MAG: hypothetical protein ACRD01_00075, partial [Terriglobales bacterium]